MNSSDPRQSTATGWTWASRVSSVALEFSLPALAGWWVDTRWGLRPLGVLAGAAIGFAIGMTHLLKIAKTGSTD